VALKAEAGSVKTTEAVAVQEFASVTVRVYVPAANPLIAAVLAEYPAGPDQAYESVPVPPTAAPFAAPVEPPLHKTFVLDETSATSAVGSVMVTVTVVLPLALSVTVTV
jgi:hypothetical protein